MKIACHDHAWESLPISSPASAPGFVMPGGGAVTAPLPTLAEIDHLLMRSVVAETRALAEIADLWAHIEDVREKRDAMLDCRTQVAALLPR